MVLILPNVPVCNASALLNYKKISPHSLAADSRNQTYALEMFASAKTCESICCEDIALYYKKPIIHRLLVV